MLEDYERKDLYRLLVARSDLTAAINAARYVIEHVKSESHPLWIPLQDAALVSYARPFTANKPFGTLPARYSKFDSPKLQELHEEILTLRHKTIAHSDADIRQIVVVPAGVAFGPPDVGKNGGVAVTTTKLPPARFRDIEELCLDVGRRVNAHADALSKKLLKSGDLPDRAFDLLTGEYVPDGNPK